MLKPPLNDLWLLVSPWFTGLCHGYFTQQESLNIPDCPFSEKRLSGLPGGMTRMGAGIIKGKLDGHATSSDISAPGCSPGCSSFLDFLKYFFKHFRVHLFKFIILLGLKTCRLVRKGHTACQLASFCKSVYEPEFESIKLKCRWVDKTSDFLFFGISSCATSFQKAQWLRLSFWTDPRRRKAVIRPLNSRHVTSEVFSNKRQLWQAERCKNRTMQQSYSTPKSAIYFRAFSTCDPQLAWSSNCRTRGF